MPRRRVATLPHTVPAVAVLTRHYRDLLAFCRRKTRDRHLAADLAQESFARVLALEQAGRLILDPGALLRQVALNAKIDWDRRAAVRQHEDLAALEEATQPLAPAHTRPDEACATAQHMRAYAQVIADLPPRCREAFSLYAFDGLPNKDIAARMGVSLSMVNQYVARGKLACAACRDTLEGRAAPVPTAAPAASPTAPAMAPAAAPATGPAPLVRG